MLTKNAQLCIDDLASDDLKFRVHETDSDTLVELGFAGTDGEPNVRMVIVFDDDDTALTIKCFSYVSFAPDFTTRVITLCDELNRLYRFGKFYTDPEDRTVEMQVSSFVTSDDVVDVMHQCIGMMLDALKDEYPKFMRLLWG